MVSVTEDGTVHIRNVRTHSISEFEISFVARLTGAEITIPFLQRASTKTKTALQINPYTYECIDFAHMYALGPLAGDKLVRFLQGGAFACAASLFKNFRQTSPKTTYRT